MICEDAWGASEGGCFDASKRLGWKTTYLAAGLLSINPWDYRDNAKQHGVWKGVMSTVWHVAQGKPNKEQPTTNYLANLMDHLHDIHHYAH
jgi:hypothetical protein